MDLITGATGFLGHHLLKELVKNQLPIRATYRKGSDSKLIEQFPQVDWIQADILDCHAISEACKGVDKIFHCAAMVSFNPKEKEQMMKVNVEGTSNIVNCAIDEDIKKFIHVSSVAAVGRSSEHKIISESNEWETSSKTSAYSKSKYKAEMEVWRGMAEGLNAVIVNPSIILGEWKWNLGTGKFFERAAKEPLFYTKGISGFVDVKDVVKAIILLSNNEVANERFILNSENLSFQDLFDSIANQLGKKKAKYEATSFLSGLAWRIEALRAFFTQKAPLITRETANSANSVYHYSNEKFLKNFPNFQFNSVESTIERTAKAFLQSVAS